MQGATPRDAVFIKALCTDEQGFSLQAAVRCAAHERQRLEQGCRYITRPALANERVQINSAGQVVLRLKTAWRDGTTHIVMVPLEFMQRLAVRLPRSPLHFGATASRRSISLIKYPLRVGTGRPDFRWRCRTAVIAGRLNLFLAITRLAYASGFISSVAALFPRCTRPGSAPPA